MPKKKSKASSSPSASSASKSTATQDHLHTYTLSDLGKTLDYLSSGEQSKVQERLDEYNGGRQKAFSGHIGVGNVWTMDVGFLSGGGGRGDARLQFLSSSLEVVNHKGKSVY